MTPEQLQSVYAKMAWSRGHFDSLDAEIVAWLKDDTHSISYERNSKLTEHYLIAKFGSKPRFDRWPLMLGDCVTNLRDTLDHLIYSIAHMPGSPTPAKADRAAFIIRNTLPDFTHDAKQRLCSVPDVVRNAVLSFQPFNRPHAVLPPLLAVLAELANGSKHKLLNVVLTHPESMDVEFVTDGKVHHEETFAGLKKGGITEGVPFFIVKTPHPDPNFRLKTGQIGFNIAIAHAALPGNTTYDAGHTSYRILLQSLFDEVEHIVNAISDLV